MLCALIDFMGQINLPVRRQAFPQAHIPAGAADIGAAPDDRSR